MCYKKIDMQQPNDILLSKLYADNQDMLLNSGDLLSSHIKYKIKNINTNEYTKENIENTLENINIDVILNDAKNLAMKVSHVDKFYDFANEKILDKYTYQHSVRVCIYATLLGIALNLSKKELTDLAAASLLHDIGKQCIDDEILNKPAKLTDEEYEKIKKHAEIGYNMLKDNEDISIKIKMGVYAHHENYDTTGYPRHLGGEDIYKFARIIHIVDVYDALISKRPYKKPMSPKLAIKYLKKNKETMFDPMLVDLFIYIVPVYPKGKLVKLSNGEKGIVIKNYKGNVLRPKIRLLDGKEISLKKDTNYKYIEIIS